MECLSQVGAGCSGLHWAGHAGRRAWLARGAAAPHDGVPEPGGCWAGRGGAGRQALGRRRVQRWAGSGCTARPHRVRTGPGLLASFLVAAAERVAWGRRGAGAAGLACQREELSPRFVPRRRARRSRASCRGVAAPADDDPTQNPWPSPQESVSFEDIMAQMQDMINPQVGAAGWVPPLGGMDAAGWRAGSGVAQTGPRWRARGAADPRAGCAEEWRARRPRAALARRPPGQHPRPPGAATIRGRQQSSCPCCHLE